jgi:enoyl-CoA hydratase
MLHLQSDGVTARLSIRRPEKKNAFTTAMWRSLHEHCAALAANSESAPRVLLVQGEPNAFCAGADIAEMTELVRDPAAMARNNATVAAAQLALEHLPLPTIAVIDGPCFGGGLGIAAACDFRIASTRASFAVTPARLGLLYSIEDTRRLVRVLGDHHARRLLMRGDTLDAATAQEWGLLDALVEPAQLEATAQVWAEGFATRSRTSMAGLKATLAFVGGSGAHAEGQVRAAFDAAFRGPDFAEGAAAFLARREPQFR